jgi:hypothetical protein
MEVSTKWQREWRLGRPWFSIPGIVASTTSHCRIGVATSSAPARSVEIGRLPSLSSSSSDPLDYGRTTGSFKPAEWPLWNCISTIYQTVPRVGYAAYPEDQFLLG